MSHEPLDIFVGETSVALVATGPNGITAEEAALAIIGRATDNDRKTIRRQLARLVIGRMARKETGKRNGHGSEGDRWYATPQATWGAT